MNAPILAVLRGALLFLCLLTLMVSNESLAQRGRVTPIFNSAATPRYTPPRPMMPTQVTPRTPQLNTAARGPTMAPGTTTGVRMVRPLPVTVKPNSAVAQVPSYTGRVTVKGAPIVVSRTGKTFSVPQVGVFSTRIITRYQTIKTALIQKFGSGRIVVLKQRIAKVITGTRATTIKLDGGSTNLPNIFNAKSIAPKIAAGHGYQKHVIERRDVPAFIKTREDYAKHIEKVISYPTAQRKLKDGRTAYWDEETKFVVITSPNDKKGDYGTAFSPERGRKYFDEELR